MKLNEIKEKKGARKSLMRVGRGIGSGKGKTCGRGVKGQTSRAGVRLKGFEGGQNPLYRTFAKRGFKNTDFKNVFAELTLTRLQRAIDAKAIDPKKTLDVAALVASGVIRREKDGVKLIATGEIKTAVNLKIAAATAGAIKAVEKAGGKVEIFKPVDLPKEKTAGAKPDPRKAKNAARKKAAPKTKK